MCQGRCVLASPPFTSPGPGPGCSGLQCPGTPRAVNSHGTDGRAGARALGTLLLCLAPCHRLVRTTAQRPQELLASGVRFTRWRFVDMAAELSQHLAGLALLLLVGRQCLLGTSSATSDAETDCTEHGRLPVCGQRSAVAGRVPGIGLLAAALCGSRQSPAHGSLGAITCGRPHWYCLQQV